MPVRLIVGDTETTSAEADRRICEIAWIEVDQDLTEVSRFRTLVDPEAPISPSAMGVHHIREQDVADAPTLAEVFDVVIPNHFANDDEVVLIAHKSEFDRHTMKERIPIVQDVCTLRLARYFWPDAPDHKLQTLRYLFGLEVGEGAHGALEDCETVLALLRHMCDTQGKTLADLQSLCQGPLPVTRMYFGKHRKTLLKDIPRGYRVWLLGTDIDEDLRYSLGAL